MPWGDYGWAAITIEAIVFHSDFMGQNSDMGATGRPEDAESVCPYDKFETFTEAKYK